MRRNLTNQVETLLKDIPQTRDCDILLTQEIWKKYYPQYLHSSPTGKLWISFDGMKVLPREDNVKRIRAKFQNDLNKYLPTKIEVVRQRRQNEQVWREALGY
jgi:hypothetical protein